MKRIFTEHAGWASASPQCSRCLRSASARSRAAVMEGRLSLMPAASSFSRYSTKFGLKPIWVARAAAFLKSGVSISSRYCSFCAAARVATSSSHSPMWRLSVPASKLVEGAKEVIVSGIRGHRHESAHGKGVDKVVVEMLILRRVAGRDLPPCRSVRSACPARPCLCIGRLKHTRVLVSTQR